LAGRGGRLGAGAKRLDLRVVRRRSRAEGDVRSDHADERAPAHAGELPKVRGGTRSGRDRIAIGFDAASPDHDDGVRTELRHRVVLGGLAE